MNRDRRDRDRGHVDRRKSTRWEPAKSLRRRVLRGRQIRESRIAERSLNGLVLGAPMPDAVAAGTRIVVSGGRNESDRLGFRSAIVRRAECGGNGGRMLFAETEA